MKAQHKVLPDGTGAGKGWLFAQAANKGFFHHGHAGPAAMGVSLPANTEATRWRPQAQGKEKLAEPAAGMAATWKSALEPVGAQLTTRGGEQKFA